MYEYAAYYQVNVQLLLGVASCESHFRPEAYGGGNYGPFQFNERGIWYSYVNPYRLTNKLTDVEANVAAAALLFSRGYGSGNWPNTYGRDCRGSDGF